MESRRPVGEKGRLEWVSDVENAFVGEEVAKGPRRERSGGRSPLGRRIVGDSLGGGNLFFGRKRVHHLQSRDKGVSLPG